MTTPPVRIRVLSGVGRYTDPWHPFAETSAAIADVATDAGYAVEVVDTEPDALTDLTEVDLVVVNAGGNPTVDLDPDPVWAASFGAFERWLADGHPVLGVHAASNAFPDWPRWSTVLGGRWVRGTSMHPARSDFTFTAAPAAVGHPALGGLTEVTVHDERYSRLALAATAVPLLQHEFEDAVHPMVWVTTEPGPAAYDGLGHDHRSYESADRRRLLVAELGWLAAQRPSR